MDLLPLEGNLDATSDTGIILPTYCEVANIERLIQEIESLNLGMSILVIDDSSPDHTAETVRRLQREHENILLLVRPKKSGLGTAITDGFKAFLSLKNPPKCIVTMDADYSHNPKDIPKLMGPVKKGYSLVIGSRYCEGGGAVDWSLVRLVISKVANLIASSLIGEKLNDYTSGMRCYSTKMVNAIIGDLHSETYEIQIETIRQAHLRRFKIGEVPIIFTNRKKGKSKLSFNEIKQFVSYIFFKAVLHTDVKVENTSRSIVKTCFCLSGVCLTSSMFNELVSVASKHAVI
jgi:dolichol-phosphate mannosyltransferase